MTINGNVEEAFVLKSDDLIARRVATPYAMKR